MAHLDQDLAAFAAIGPSYLAAHSASCCEFAKLQVHSRLDRDSIASSLSLIPIVVQWAPTRWPHHWCTLLATATNEDGGLRGDCGVHAALARSLLDRHGVAHRSAAIAIREFGFARPHWRRMWEGESADRRWLGQSTVYHEVVRVGDQFWDPTEARWFGGVGATLDCGRVVASRVETDAWSVEAE